MQTMVFVGTPEEVRAKTRLEYLRGEIEAERISYGEIVELQGLREYIDDGDITLLEWAGVPEGTKCNYCGEDITGNRNGRCPFCNTLQ